MFSGVSEELPCDECVSGTPKCLCTVHGECKEQDMNMIQAIPEVPTIGQCEEHCSMNSECKFYTYLDDNHPAFGFLCLLFDQCDILVEECEGCVTGTLAECEICTFEDTVNGICDADACEPDWNKFGQSCYKLLDNNGHHYTTRDACNDDCEKAGGTLTSIHSQKENDFLTNLIRPNEKMYTWIGADAVLDATNTFVWMDGTEWDYTNWLEGDPEGNQRCVWLGFNKEDPGKWIDEVCSLHSGMNCICKQNS